MNNINLQFFTQKVQMHSPTYFELLKGTRAADEDDYPCVDMTANISIHDSEDEHGDPELDFLIRNKMWKDPKKEEDGDAGEFHLRFSMTKSEALFLHKYLEAFLTKNKPDNHE